MRPRVDEVDLAAVAFLAGAFFAAAAFFVAVDPVTACKPKQDENLTASEQTTKTHLLRGRTFGSGSCLLSRCSFLPSNNLLSRGLRLGSGRLRGRLRCGFGGGFNNGLFDSGRSLLRRWFFRGCRLSSSSLGRLGFGGGLGLRCRLILGMIVNPLSTVEYTGKESSCTSFDEVSALALGASLTLPLTPINRI